MEDEFWIDVINYEGIYQVSNLGNIKSLDRIVYRNNEHPIPLKGSVKNKNSSRRYLSVTLCKNGKRECLSVHKIVFLSFNNIKKMDKGYVIDHIDNNPLNNNLKNLQIITFRNNISKDIKNKTSKFTGVHWCKNSKKWKSNIRINNKKVYLGRFDNEQDAHNKYQEALNEIKFKI